LEDRDEDEETTTTTTTTVTILIIIINERALSLQVFFSLKNSYFIITVV
jgi:hypothetical protein